MKALPRLLFVSLLLLAGFWSRGDPQPVPSDRRVSADQINPQLQRGKVAGNQAHSYPDLPDIAQFQTNRSDRFLVNLEFLAAGHPFKGSLALQPHLGAHVHWDNSTNAWPKGGTAPSNYPAIYAVADARNTNSYSTSVASRYCLSGKETARVAGRS